jgi:hypothetical protein
MERVEILMLRITAEPVVVQGTLPDNGPPGWPLALLQQHRSKINIDSLSYRENRDVDLEVAVDADAGGQAGTPPRLCRQPAGLLPLVLPLKFQDQLRFSLL